MNQKKNKKELPAAVVLLSFLALGAFLLMTTACGGDAAKGTLTVGISKIVAHPALDAIEQGIQDELADLGYDEVKYDLQNANGDMNTASSIAQKFKAQKVDVAVGIATPTAQALVNHLKDIPVIYSAVTDPVAAGLVTSYEEGEETVTGISDMTPVGAQLELLNRLTPVKTLGHIYSSSEANAVVLAEKAREVAADMGMEFVETTVTNSAEVRQAALAIVDKVDAIYISNDNTVVSALASVAEVAQAQGVPIMSADPTSAEDLPILAAWGFDYYKMGRATGKLIDRIVRGESPSKIPTQYMTDASDVNLLLNKDVAKDLGITFPSDALEAAAVVVENGKMITGGSDD